jgi:hypothetical protein
MDDVMIQLPSDKNSKQIHNPVQCLLAFCKEEYDYYDAIHSSNPNCIEPIDVLATVSVNSKVDNATRVRQVHRELAQACNPFLIGIPEEADILSFDQSIECMIPLLNAAVQVRYVLIPVATKVLHRKRRFLIPMLDNILLAYYLNTSDIARTQDSRFAADIAGIALSGFRDDLAAVNDEIAVIRNKLAQEGYLLSPVRILEILIWMAEEPRGYYRNAPA